MKKIFAVLILFASSVAVFAVAAQRVDADSSRGLVGTWSRGEKQTQLPESVTTFCADGTGTETFWRQSQTQKFSSVTVQFEWRVENAVLITKSVGQSTPVLVPPGTVLKDKIIALTADRFEYETYGGYSPEGSGIRLVKYRTKPN